MVGQHVINPRKLLEHVPQSSPYSTTPVIDKTFWLKVSKTWQKTIFNLSPLTKNIIHFKRFQKISKNKHCMEFLFRSTNVVQRERDYKSISVETLEWFVGIFTPFWVLTIRFCIGKVAYLCKVLPYLPKICHWIGDIKRHAQALEFFQDICS